MAASLPKSVRDEVLIALVKQFDAHRWEELSNAEASEMYDRFLKDPTIGGRLEPFMARDKIRVWIKDGPAKEYRRALEGVGTIAPLTKRAYPGPQSVVTSALGNGWVVRPGSIEEKPMRCIADCGNGSVYVTWGSFASLQALYWSASALRVRDPDLAIMLAVTRPSNAPLTETEWMLVSRLSDLIGAECKQITYAVTRKAP